jgi:hypothetical protein
MTFITFVLCILIWTISWRVVEYNYNRHLYNYFFTLKGKNNIDGYGVFPNDLENGLYYHDALKLNNIKMLNRSQPHSHPIYY